MIRTGIAGALALAIAAPAHADTLIDNVDGLTLDATGGVDRFTGLLVGDDGRIVQVLRRGDKRPGKVDYFVDGQGQVLQRRIGEFSAEMLQSWMASIARQM